MKNNEFLFEIISCDGKKYGHEIVELNVKTQQGMIGILKNHYPLVSFIDITTFNIVFENNRDFFSVSGATLNVKKDKVVILCDSFEHASELDKERITKKVQIAKDKIKESKKYDLLDLAQAERSLKKALNRLSLIK